MIRDDTHDSLFTDQLNEVHGKISMLVSIMCSSNAEAESCKSRDLFYCVYKPIGLHTRGMQNIALITCFETCGLITPAVQSCVVLGLYTV